MLKKAAKANFNDIRCRTCRLLPFNVSDWRWWIGTKIDRNGSIWWLFNRILNEFVCRANIVLGIEKKIFYDYAVTIHSVNCISTDQVRLKKAEPHPESFGLVLQTGDGQLEIHQSLLLNQIAKQLSLSLLQIASSADEVELVAC